MEADLYEEINGMIQLYLIRHSMTAGNLKKRYIGRTDESLCPEGIVLLESYIQKNIYPEVQRVYVSPMKRCMETAKLIFKENFYEVEELRECDFGIFENKNYKELSDCPEYQAWIDSGGTMTFPEGEDPEEFRKRCVRGFEKVIKECRHDQIKSVAVVAHGGTIMSIMDRYARDENGQPDGSYYDYQVKNGEGYELIIADVPVWLYHPVRMIGHLISGVEKIIRSLFPSGKTGERIGGGLLVVIVVAVSMAVPGGILYLAYHISFYLGLAVESFMCYQILATKSLKVESDRVYQEIQTGDIARARKAVSMIVGRDTQNLTIEGVTKAAVETVAENTSDGVIAPLFYMVIGGALLGFGYKAVNTMDSMVGYKNEKYQYFGTAAAKFDDVVNYIPARLSACLMILASAITHMDWKNAKKIFLRDRYNHKSPNSAQTESVMAGALDVQLAGDAWYFGKLCKKPTIGDAIREIEPEDIRRSHTLLYMTAVLALVVFEVVKVLVCLWYFTVQV